MRSVILRSRPGRPRWQLTTRPGTAVLLGVVSLAAAGVQIALLSSPTPWYQPAVAGFWTLVGIAFLASAAGTRSRVRRAATAARTRVPVDSMPFVPVPIRPARPRRRDEPERDGRAEVPLGGEGGEVDTGEPTDDLADAVQTAVTPVVAASTGPPVRRRPERAEPPVPVSPPPRSESSESSEPSEVPTTTRWRHAVRAVASVETASREIPLPAVEEVPVPSPRASTGRVSRSSSAGAAADARAIRDGRLRAAASEARRPAAPTGAVPSQRRGPEGAGAPHDVRPADTRRAAGRRQAPNTGGTSRPATRLTFGHGGADTTSSTPAPSTPAPGTPAPSTPAPSAPVPSTPARRAARAPAPADTGRHALVEPRDIPGPRHSGTPSTRRARHAAPSARDRVR